ncbi:MAG: MBL fold metallo-hydrolase [Candidatus Melainabacteria bacterium]|nr:MBL fold metallo-hydrolase [Candidatus Melainabacteria bacterium]
MQGRFLFLGTGGSTGVPMIGCGCEVCHSTSTFDKRLRSSGLIKIQDKNFLIDVGPDFRIQALHHKIQHLTGVLLTHAHADHIAGMDDLRAYYFKDKKKVPCVLSNETFEEVKVRYHYMLQPAVKGKSLAAQLDFSLLPDDFGVLEFEGVRIHYMTYYQQQMKVTGFRIGNFAYISDIREYSDRVIEMLDGVETLVLSALRHTPNAMHFSVEEAVAFSRRVGATTTYLTHIAHDLGHEATNAMLPSDVRMSYDGLEIPIVIPDEELR